jgi:hypothetical protein
MEVFSSTQLPSNAEQRNEIVNDHCLVGVKPYKKRLRALLLLSREEKVKVKAQKLNGDET